MSVIHPGLIRHRAATNKTTCCHRRNEERDHDDVGGGGRHPHAEDDTGDRGECERKGQQLPCQTKHDLVKLIPKPVSVTQPIHHQNVRHRFRGGGRGDPEARVDPDPRR